MAKKKQRKINDNTIIVGIFLIFILGITVGFVRGYYDGQVIARDSYWKGYDKGINADEADRFFYKNKQGCIMQNETMWCVLNLTKELANNTVKITNITIEPKLQTWESFA